MPSDTYTLTISDVGVSTPADGSVTTAKIANLNVTTGKIADSAITSAKIANGTIEEADIADSAITSIKIANGTVTGTDIATGTITSSNILDGTIAAGDIANGAVTTDKIGTGTIVNNNIATNTIDLGKIAQISAGRILGNATTGTANVVASPCTTFGFQMLAAADAAGGRTALGLGTISTQPSDNVSITGGTISGIALTSTLTNCTGLPISGLTASTVTALGVGSINLGDAADTTISRVSAGKIAVEGVNVVTTSSTDTLTNKTLTSPTLTGPILGIPLTGTLTNCTGLPISGLTASTSTALGVGSIELGHATDTTISRVSAGKIAVEGVNVVTTESTDTLLNKTFAAPILGTPAAGSILTNCTGLPLVTGVTGILPIANGGTNSSTGVDLTAALVTGILPISKGGTGNTTGTSVIGETDTLSFKTTGQTTDALATGELRWNGEDKTLDLKLAGDVTLQVGQENNIYVHNAELVNTIPNGSVVYIYGADGNNPAVKLATNADFTASKTLGVATQSITAGSHGYITTQGLVRGLNTSTFSSGDSLWLGVGGALTATEPVFPATPVRVAIVVRDDVSLGSIFVQPQLFSDGRVSGRFDWLTNTTSGPTINVVGMTSSSNVIIMERGVISPTLKSYSVICSSGSFTPYVNSSTGMAGLVYSYIAFI